MAGNFSNLERDFHNQVHEGSRSLQNSNQKLSSPRHIKIKLSKIKNRKRTLKEKKILTYKRIPIRLSAYLSAEIIQDKREWDIYSKYKTKQNLPTKNALPGKTVFQK